MTVLDAAGQDLLFRQARTRNGWTPEPITDAQIHELYELMKFGPTSANGSPGRFVWLRSEEAKARIKPSLSAGNYKALAASAIVIVGHDVAWNEHLPQLFPHAPGAKDWFGDAAALEVHAFRNGALQGAYLMIAARALGFDVGPMSGFDSAAVDKEFFAGTTFRSNFIFAIGHGTEENLKERLPRLSFDQANTVL
jgi:3-hydroxypropanoate dehydrogenase